MELLTVADSCRIESDVLIIGAGPFGLSLAARLAHLGVDYRIVGEPMGFWRHSMPAGMFLRSSWDWHLDPQGNFTIERFLDEEGIGKGAVSPFPLATYLQYAEWFRRQSGIEPLGLRVQRLDSGDHRRFAVTCEDGTQIDAGSVVLALGFSHFPHVPNELGTLLPGNRVAHTLEFVDLGQARDTSILLIGGRQSAFEWAALLCEAGAAEVHITHRHPSPAFAEADWTWVPPLMENMVQNPAWFRELPESERTALTRRLWAEGRLKVEPWLESRFRNAPISIWPESHVTRCAESDDGTVAVQLSNGTELAVDSIVLATGYKADIARVELLRQGNVFDRIETVDGLPVLDEHFQSSVPGLYMTSYLATRDFGPFFGFTVAAWAAARVLGDELGRAIGKGR
jgi:cation diffusion facilitator CzcD-associated flavoprotein CzcO